LDEIDNSGMKWPDYFVSVKLLAKKGRDIGEKSTLSGECYIGDEKLC